MEHYNWAAIPEEKLNKLTSRWVIHTPQATIARWWFGKGAIVAWHHHVNEQVTMLKSGLLRFETPEKEVLVRPGEVLRIPPNLPHRVEALEESTATDLFTPAREDWMKGEDAYFGGRRDA
jgi:quercetin dioxygenase-like cupin family protein